MSGGLSEAYRKIRAAPLARLPGRIREKFWRDATRHLERRRDKSSTTTLTDCDFERILGNDEAVEQLLSFPDQVIPPSDVKRITAVAAASPASSGFKIVAKSARLHSFDLLGSNPTIPDYVVEADGAFGSRYQNAPGPIQELAQLQRIGDLVRDTESFLESHHSHIFGRPDNHMTKALECYSPIDWHLDFKSGYRWNPELWWLDTPVAPAPGVDIKLPWELSRSHHLVAIALAGVSEHDTVRNKEDAATEISLQILDWIAANPVRFGVNWRSAMDVSIRAANWIVALSILGSEAFSSPVLWLIAKSLYQHGQFVESHLDFARIGSNNHYLADIVGLLHISAALPQVPESDAWAALCIQELVVEMGREVLADGTSYEGSTGYHRLAAEMFHHGTLTALRIPEKRRSRLANAQGLRKHSPSVDPRIWEFDPGTSNIFPDWYLERLSLMAELTHDLTKPNGLVPQFGDQDGGRFLKFHWPAERGSTNTVGFKEEQRDHRHLLAISQGLFGADASSSHACPIESAAGTVPKGLILSDPGRPASDITQHEWLDGSSKWHSPGGYYVAHSGQIWLCVRCEQTPVNAPMGHRHNDQLSFELNVGGIDFLVDPGSGTYTPNHELRDRLRSTASHNTVFVEDSEQRSFPNGPDGLFTTFGNSNAEVDSIGPGTFSATHRWSGNIHRRSFIIEKTRIVIKDRIQSDGHWALNYIVSPDVIVATESDAGIVRLTGDSISLSIGLDPKEARVTTDTIPYAPSYGRIGSAIRLNVTPINDYCTTTIEIDPVLGAQV